MLRPKRLVFIPLILAGIFLSFESFRPNPPGAIGPYMNGIFPATVPGEGGSWELVDALPNLELPPPVRILPFPGTDDIAYLGKIGEIWRIDLETQTKTLLLDITDRSFKKGEAGTVGMAFHPAFGDPGHPDKQSVFVYYRTKPEPDSWSEKGFNRLSRFSWDAARQMFDPDTEEILIQQYDRSTWHNSGDLFFGPEGFLYFSVGDEGMDDHQVVSTQRLDGGFFSGLFRIDVDNDPGRSHPIRRQPQANAAAPDGWGETFSQGYSIPNDNPWQDPEGGVLEEYYALGLRSPFVMSYDADRDLIWVADVGAGQREEINQVRAGDNLQWPYREGTLPYNQHERPDQLIGRETPSFYEYDRSVGACIIGGGVYKGTAFPSLNGKYLFADYISNKLMTLSDEGPFTEPVREVLIDNLGAQSGDLPEQPGITGVFALPDGEVLVSVMGRSEDFAPGKVLRLRQKVVVPDPPARLSDLGVFTDLETLTPSAGILPYDVQSPLWSDRALKKRWIAIPNDGAYDQPDEQVVFQAKEDWSFPEGTVFIKHFELPVTTDPEGPTTRLETRFLVVGEDQEAYGLTYQWNEDQTEAFLLGGAASRTFPITDEQGQLAMMQTWDYPSRSQCLTCHNANANYVLGVKTHQLNGQMTYPELEHQMNQLHRWNQLGIFSERIGPSDVYPAAAPIADTSATLERRIRSYLDANCASCHRAGGVPTSTMDLRFNQALPFTNLLGVRTQSPSSGHDREVITPGFHEVSEFWIRDASLTENRMPPIGRNLIDEAYIDALAEWIDGMPEDIGEVKESVVFPNPSFGEFALRLRDGWEGPFTIHVYSISGQKVLTRKSYTQNIHLDLSDRPAGLYEVEVIGPDDRWRERVMIY